MESLAAWQYAAIGLLFCWGGFARSGLGFGGGVLTLPFLLLVVDEPLLFLPIIGMHLLFFSALTVARGQRDGGRATVNWGFLKYALPLMLAPKLIGVLGVITLPADIISGFIFAVVSVYALGYLLERPFKSNSRAVDALFLLLGGYVSGTSLIAAPLVVPVAASRMPREQLRDTLFVLWFILVSIKLAAFVWAGVDMQWLHHLWLLPCAALGHSLGQRFHEYTLRAETRVFFRAIGAGLLGAGLIGLARILLAA